MGNKKSQLTEEELEDYKDLTYLTRKEILQFKEFNEKLITRDKFARIPFRTIMRMPELQNNPFADRICEIFSSKNDNHLSFEDFLDMVSVFSEEAPMKKKAEYAFNIYDFDQDGYLSRADLWEVICRLTGKDQLTDSEMDVLLEKILEEADLDQDGQLSQGEFEHVMRKTPDFAKSFSFRL